MKSKITEEKFEAYLKVRDSGITNMFNVSAVIDLSDGILTKEDCLDIMRNFGGYTKKWGNGDRS